MSNPAPAHTANTHNANGTAVITGASAGLGKVYADRLAKRGYDLVLVARRADRLDAIAAALRAQYGVAVRTVVADLGARDDLERVAADIGSDASVTVLVNNAGTSTFAPLGDTTAEQLAAMNDVNVAALVRLSQVIVPRFKARNRGTVINIGSVLGLFSFPGSAVYSGGKAYVNHFTRALQDEVAGTGVVVQLVAPSATATEIWDIAGVPVTNLQAGSVMTADACVDAALAGLDQGETVTFPSLENPALFAAYEQARAALVAAFSSGTPASRYGVGH